MSIAQRERQLSMDMTGDFEVAIEEGATLVRVGRAVFGARVAVARAAPARLHQC